MNRQLVAATTNPGKLREIRELLGGSPYDILSLADIGFSQDIAEDGKTFEENAIKKARTIYEYCGKITIADDSGLMIEHLNGEPGVDSALYMGVDTPYPVRFTHILERLAGIEGSGRAACFVCVVAIASSKGIETVRGECAGLIAKAPLGAGFGYDPIFYLPSQKKTFGEMSIQEKNAISHRGIALRLTKERLYENFGI